MKGLTASLHHWPHVSTGLADSGADGVDMRVLLLLSLFSWASSPLWHGFGGGGYCGRRSLLHMRGSYLYQPHFRIDFSLHLSWIHVFKQHNTNQNNQTTKRFATASQG